MKIINCPNCKGRMVVKRLYCNKCDISLEGNFLADKFGYLEEEILIFIEKFILAEGNIKTLEKELNISYPTVKAKINKMVTAVKDIKVKEEAMKKQTIQKEKDNKAREDRVKEIIRKK